MAKKYEYKHKTKNQVYKTFVYLCGSLALGVLASVIVPKYIKKGAIKLYKKQNANKEYDFDNIGPEIEKKS